MTPGERMAAVAIGHGRRAARCIDGWLHGVEPASRREASSRASRTLNTWYFADAPRAVQPVLEDVRRQSTFEEVVKGLDDETALYEARRCLSCGNCFSCDNCFGVCPDNAVLKPGPPGEPYAFDLDYCKGCGICADGVPLRRDRDDPRGDLSRARPAGTGPGLDRRGLPVTAGDQAGTGVSTRSASSTRRVE